MLCQSTANTRCPRITTTFQLIIGLSATRTLRSPSVISRLPAPEIKHLDALHHRSHCPCRREWAVGRLLLFFNEKPLKIIVHLGGRLSGDGRVLLQASTQRHYFERSVQARNVAESLALKPRLRLV